MADRIGHGRAPGRAPGPTGGPDRRRGSSRILLALGAVALLAGCGGQEEGEGSGEAVRTEGETGLEERQARVAAAGARVMPFDLDRTTHVFEPVEDGGIQTVVSDDGDPEQIGLIRDHLAEEAERFAQGDFHDPAMIHGDDMAGMHALVVGHDRLTITYRDVPDGGEIRYRTGDPELVRAVHTWFEAQVADHGHHARSHRPSHRQSHR